MCLPRIPLTTKSGTVNASTLGDPAKISGIHFTGKLITDVDCTLTDCQFDAPVDNQPGKKVQLVNCLVSPTSVGDWGIGPDKVSATRSVIEGNSDGVRFENMNLIECWVRVKLQSAADHNDGLQCYQSSAGGSILRCNIDANPHDSAHSDIFGNGAIFIADGSKGEYEIRDNWLTGGGYTLRLHESGTYRVTGNIIEKGKWLFGPLTTTNAVSGAFKEWSNNTLSDGSILNQQ